MRGLALVLVCGASVAVAQPAPRPRPSERPPGSTAEETPSRARCADPVAGTWQAKVFRSESGRWDRVTLSIRRRRAQLSGTITVETWDGGADQAQPPLCPDQRAALEVWRQRLAGTVDGVRLDVRGRAPHRVAGACGRPGTGGYAPDHFSGEVAVEAELLTTTNDDGDTDLGRPHHFHRLSCRP